ncbi:MAG: hypothetical protein JSS76_09195 [Bacteroidetes bacterium]|nr:hypothetical protein [Bacteroidota bacterium]
MAYRPRQPAYSQSLYHNAEEYAAVRGYKEHVAWLAIGQGEGHGHIESPPRSGRMMDIPEIDRAEWFDLDTARQKIIAAQVAFLDLLTQLLLRKD